MPVTTQVLHDRAFASARDTRGHVITMAVASLAFFVVALTNTKEIIPGLTPWQRRVVTGAVGTMAVSIFSGVLRAYADALWGMTVGIARLTPGGATTAPTTEAPAVAHPERTRVAGRTCCGVSPGYS